MLGSLALQGLPSSKKNTKKEFNVQSPWRTCRYGVIVHAFEPRADSTMAQQVTGHRTLIEDY